MSHHLDSPAARQDPRLDLTDSFVFKGERGTVFVMNVNTSLAEATPGFHPEARYEFKVHLDDSAVENLTYRFVFDERDQNGHQRWSAFRSAGPDARNDSSRGELLLEGTTGTTTSNSEQVRVWAGRALDPFYLDLAQLAAVGSAVRSGTTISYGEWAPAEARNTFDGSNIFTIVLEIPFTDHELLEGRRIATWSTTKLATDAGGWHPINRAGLPMMWPIFRPDDSEIADHANLTRPEDDRTNYLEVFTEQISGVTAALGTTNSPAACATEVATKILPDLLPYVVGTDAEFGFAGINGRFLSDNAPEVMFSLVTNSAISTGLTPAASAIAAGFPYVAVLDD
jgi:Domain of unknown function (DUF4331)